MTYEWTAMKEDARAAGAGTGTGGDAIVSTSTITTAAITTCHGKDHSGDSTMEGGSINDPGSEGGDLPWPGYGKRAFDASDMQLEFLPYEGRTRAEHAQTPPCCKHFVTYPNTL